MADGFQSKGNTLTTEDLLAALGKRFKESLALMQENFNDRVSTMSAYLRTWMNALESRNSASSYIISSSP